MSNPYDKARELARAIAAHPVYQDYVAAKKELDKTPELKDRILELRQKQFELNQAYILGKEPSPGIGEITLEFAKLSQKAEAKDYFDYEARLTEMLNDIYKIIEDTLQLAMDD
ncbi:MAG: YlbF family regulator [Syntrophomonadaceae bacterium]